MGALGNVPGGIDPRTSASLSARPGPGPDPGLDTTLSSTTPDVHAPRHELPTGSLLGWGVTLGAAVGALLLRAPGAGFSLGAVAAGAARGVATGAATGVGLLALDRVTNGGVARKLDYLSLDRRAQLLFVLSNPTNPWIARTGLGVAHDARATQVELYGRAEPLDGPQDAFRHAYAAALFSLRAMRDHGESPLYAHSLALEAGAAHETDGQDNNDAASRAMDHRNNFIGTRIVGDGRARPGEEATPDGFVTERALRDRVLAAMSGGQLQLVDRSGTTPVPRSSSVHDIPSSLGR